MSAGPLFPLTIKCCCSRYLQLSGWAITVVCECGKVYRRLQGDGIEVRLPYTPLSTEPFTINVRILKEDENG